MSRYKQGNYKVKNRIKYAGNPDKVYYRSSWELKIFEMMDLNSMVKKWNSEEIIIPYYDSIKKKKRKYYTDIYAEFTNGKIYIFEIKPSNKLIRPDGKNLKLLAEHVNILEKANSAHMYCQVLKRKGVNIKFAFLSLIKGKFQIIDYK